MAKHLPNLAALRAFQSAARYLNFTKAAEELCITQSAVSHQIKGLEEQIGAPLFLRGPKHIALTRKGQQYLDQIAPLLDQLADATREVSGARVSGTLNIQVSPVFAARWLMPRLDRFRKDWPDIDLNILTHERHDLGEQSWDIRINCGYRFPPSPTEEPFLFTTQCPVCSPELLAKGSGIETIEDLARYPILRDRERDGWDEWFELAGWAGAPKLNEIWVDNGYVLMAAAEAGQGIALGYSVLIEEALEKRQLVKVFEVSSAPVLGYSVTFSKLSGRSGKVVAFRRWFSQETEALPQSESVAALRFEAGLLNAKRQ